MPTFDLRLAPRVDINGADHNRIACRVLSPHLHQTAILSSGIGCGPVFMNRIAEELAKDHRVIYWDFRAHGDSAQAPDGAGYSIEDHAADLDAVVRTWCTKDTPLLMVGFSMGVQITIEWTRRQPNRADAYVFLLGVPRNPMHRTVLLRKEAAKLADAIAGRGGRALRAVHPWIKRALRTKATYRLARKAGFVEKACPQQQFLDFVSYATAVSPDAYLQCAAGLLRHDATDVFERIQQPIYMLAAEDDVLINAEDSRSFADKMPNAKFEALRFTSHAGTLEYGPYFAGAVRRYLKSIEGKRGAAKRTAA